MILILYQVIQEIPKESIHTVSNQQSSAKEQAEGTSYGMSCHAIDW